MNSCLYQCHIYHDRHQPKRYRFNHDVFMFYIDLDDLPLLSAKSFLVGYHQHRIYDFRDQDHIGQEQRNIKENIREYLKTKGIDQQVKRIRLLTNLRVFGYIFNPVSFYYCFNQENQVVCVVVEIGNTFGELKYFYLGPDTKKEVVFSDQQTKYYYISPFTDLDDQLDFKIGIPGDDLNITIDVVRSGQKYFNSGMICKKRQLTTASLLWETLRCPLVTLKVIFLIHWHAAILHFIKRLGYHPKEENPHLQQEVYREWQK